MKTALVTGGATRIGAVTVKRLCEEGWRVFIHCNASIDKAQELARDLNAKGASAEIIQADLRETGAAERLVDEAFAASQGALCAVVNNASVFAYNEAADFTASDWERDISINLLSPILVARRLKSLLPATAQGCVVNMLDQKLWNLDPYFFTYTVSKYALLGATKTLAQALAPNVRVCAVAPGLALPSGGQTLKQFQEVASAHNLSKAPIDIDMIAESVLFALRNTALNGSCIIADNGQHLFADDEDMTFNSRGNK